MMGMIHILWVGLIDRLLGISVNMYTRVPELCSYVTLYFTLSWYNLYLMYILTCVLYGV